ncbi:MAG: NAD-dependent epimerase/dehydratase family protein [Rhodospirillaceae bacterium]|nr:NAD-dependent epimerase/dehydratase family protein [Rhodospirillaceae bacterium]MYB14515.1 NAD-dependent epimerase/dehydratase family protein [Rhodospirillaceae bacterium]MYI48809.1 NAD-dependent epimerase/dehydratase family protein [Rhodospirillaceae bacterium]
MRVIITGGAGFLARKLARAILERGTLAGPDGAPAPVSELVLFDNVTPDDLGGRAEAVTGDIGDAAAVRRLVGGDAASVFHLAAIVSAGAEEDFDLGYRVNLDGTRNLLEACRGLTAPPRLVFASSIAVYGGDLPETIEDDTPSLPQTSYGIQKLVGEQLIHDYTRKGYIDGRALRLPTIMVRPAPNRAASTWASSIIREPLQGKDYDCPVEPHVAMACLSPRRTADAFIAVHDLPGDRLGLKRTLLLSGIRATAADMADAVARNAGNRRTGAIRWTPDPATMRIVGGWPGEARGARAEALGIAPDASIDEIVRAFIADDLADDPGDGGSAEGETGR